MNYLLSEIAKICGGTFVGNDRTVERVIVDSRTPQVGEETLFTAIRTASRDGHAYIGELHARGVKGFIVGRDFDTAGFTEAGFVKVTDTVAALQAFAAHHRRQFKGRVAGITGSCGKTIVKEWIAQLTPSGVNFYRSPKSYNSQIGVPLSVLMIAGDEDYAVIEAGISEPGEMAALREIIRPDIGIITAIGQAHAENFASKAALLDEKLELFRGCPEIIYDSEYPEIGPALREKYPQARLTDAAGTDAAERGQGLLADIAESRGGKDREAGLTVGGQDDFSRRNASLALCFWRTEGYDIPVSAADSLQPVAMRLEVKEGLYNSVIVNDTYNSDINSLAIALDYLARIAGQRAKMVVMADMAVAAGQGEETYRRAAALVEAAGVSRFVGIGPRMAAHSAMFGAGSSFFTSADDFMRSVTSTELSGRAILIKGGARMQFGRISHALERRSHTTVMEIDLDAMIHNLRLCRSRFAPGVGVMPMIKASAYGHGTFEIANTLQQQGVDYLAVAFADEGVSLRESGISMPIVVLNADADSFELMIRHRLEPEIYNFISLGDFTTLLKRHGEQRYPIHIKLDTGMHRLGFGEKDIELLNAALAETSRYACVSTIFSHLAAADDPAEDDFTRRQIADFDRMSRRITAALPYPVRRHIANTKGIERFPEANFDMVRLGIGLYGIGMEGAHKVASLRTSIVNISELPAGETVGYNRRGVLARESRIATIPIGYADGLNRRLSCGAWSVLVKGRPAPIVGNVCMDSCMVDITGIPDVRVGDEVAIFSAVPGNTVEDMARVLGTIPYEVLTSISARVKRIYTKE